MSGETANRRSVEETIRANQAAGRGTLIGYLPIGFPTVDASVEAAIAIVEAGVDVLELGIPYSDPVMDGPVIQRATTTALAGGVRIADAFDVVHRVTSAVSAPALVMTYYNPVFHHGVERFAQELAAADGAGLITPDLIPDDPEQWIAASEEAGLERVFLAAPSSSDERLGMISAASRGFVYVVSTMGITGERAEVDAAARKLVSRLRGVTDKPLCVGIGISTPDQVREVNAYADGAIVGSALVSALAEGGVAAVADTAAHLAQGKSA
ncbi:MAG TPA: tryptophan synthase subunit alpha [Pseudoclavibacter sp.]|nr:tryptophan synthase subunit alpha [Pseudoclavibacter sp.]